VIRVVEAESVMSGELCQLIRVATGRGSTERLPLGVVVVCSDLHCVYVSNAYTTS